MKLVILLFALFALNAQAQFKYSIKSCSDLELLERHPNDQFILMNDLDCFDLDKSLSENFNGQLDGNGFSLFLELWNSSSTDSLFLFNKLDTKASIKDLNLTVNYRQKFNTKAQNQLHTGLAFSNSGLISNINLKAFYVDSHLTQDSQTAGLVMWNFETGIIKNVTVNIEDFSSRYFSGFVFNNKGLIDHSKVANLKLENNLQNFAGFVDTNLGTIKNSSLNSSSISLKPTDFMDFTFGGFCNVNSGTIVNSKSILGLNLDTKNYSANLLYFGGFIQFNYGKAERNNSNLSLILSNDADDKFMSFRPFFGNSDHVPSSNHFNWSIDRI